MELSINTARILELMPDQAGFEMDGDIGWTERLEWISDWGMKDGVITVPDRNIVYNTLIYNYLYLYLRVIL